LHEEELVVEKRVVAKERVRLEKDVSTSERTVDDVAQGSRSTSNASALR
jgi:hypothetical protein